MLSKVDTQKILKIPHENSPMVNFAFNKSIGRVLAVFIEITGALFLLRAIFKILTGVLIIQYYFRDKKGP